MSDTKTALQNAEQEFADSLATTTRELTAKISGIDVGGRNYLLQKISKGSANTNINEDGSVTIDLSQNIDTYFRLYAAQNLKFLEGKEVTLSFESDREINWDFGFPVYAYDNIRGIKLGKNSHTFIFPTNVDANRLVNCLFDDIRRPTTTGTVTLSRFKLEIGNIATDYSPAPEDFQSDLSNTSIELSTKITESAAKLRTEMSEKYSTKNDLTTLQGDYDSFKEQTAQKISQQVSSIQTIQTDTTNAKQLANDALSKAQNAVTSATNASSTANSALSKASDATSVANSASQNATNAVASANSAVSAANTAKSNADKAIADVASLTKTVSSQSTRIDQTSNRIDQVASGVTEVGNRLDNLQIGGRNLLTKDILSKFYGRTLTYNQDGSITTTFFYQSNVTLTNLKAGDTFTFSCKLKKEGDFEGKVRIGIYHDGAWDSYYMGSLLTKDYKMFSKTITMKNDGAIGLVIQNDNGNSTDSEKITFKELQLEIGNIATDHSPAPEDQQSQIDSLNSNLSNNYYAKTTVDSKLSTAISGITAQYTKDISTKLSNYYDKATMDRRLTIGDIGIETYVKNTQSKLDNLQVGGRNYVLDSNAYLEAPSSSLNFQFSNEIFDLNNKRITVSLDVELENAVFTRVGFEPSFIKEDNSEEFIGAWLRNNGQPITVKKRIFATWELNYKKIKSIGQRGIYIQGYKSGKIKVSKPALIDGDGKTWYPAPEDMATITQYTQVKQQADQLSSTVYDSSTGLMTKTNQLAGKYAIQNLNSYGDVLASLNLNGGNVRIKGGLIDLDGNVRIQDGFVNKLKANSILANEITAKATNIINARIVNLDASYITSGTLSANTISGGKLKSLNNNMEINLDSGDINFYARNLLQGKINNTGQAFYRDGRYLGYVGSSDKIQQQSPTPIVLCSENDNFIAFMYKNKYGSYNNSVFIDPLGITGSEGVRFLTDVYFKKIRPLGYGDTVEALACIASYYNNYNYPFFGNSSGNSGLLYGGNWLYFMHDGYVYKFEDVKKLINAFVGLGTIQIPRAIASDGTVDRWTKITI